MKCKVIAIANQKGGVGKSTTAMALATGATMQGKKSLAIDLDPQANLTFTMGGNAMDAGAYELLTGHAGTPGSLIQNTAQGALIAGSPSLAAADSILEGKQRIYALDDPVWKLRKSYQVIVIDTPPNLSTLMINALVAADQVIIPLQPDVYCMQGLSLLIQSISNVKKQYDPHLTSAILFTRYSTRTNLARDVADAVRKEAESFGIPVLHTTIREGVAIKEAQMLRKSIYEYAPNAKPVQDYKELLRELNI